MTTVSASEPPTKATSSDDLLLAESLVSLSLNNTARTALAPARKPRTAVLFQPACAKHRYIRTKDNSTIVERPERIRAVKTGVAAAYARLETALPQATHADDELDALLSGLSLDSKRDLKGKQRERELVDPRGPFDILDSNAVMSVQDRALRYIHSKPNRAPQDIAAEEEGWESASSSSSAVASTSASPTAGPKPPPAPRTGPAPWPEQLQSLCRASSSVLSAPPSLTPSTVRPSEIPAHLPQGDLYLCPGSEEAIFGALGACCEGVDRIVRGSRAGAAELRAGDDNSQGPEVADGLYDRAFVAIRPPGHHCGEANPQGFCFVNNVAVAAAHAHLEHGIDRVVIFDIDLHHGHGTQEIAWRINTEAHEILEKRERARLEAASASASRTSPRKSSPRKSSPRKVRDPTMVKKEEEGQLEPERNPLRIMYASLHDIWSYPCEDGDPALVSAASLNLNGGHGQFISNVHLDSWSSEDEFHERLYPRYRDGLVGRAEDFARLTRGADETEEDAADRTLVIVSLGCDASEHESAGMSRHGRNVPTSFYRRFALDAVQYARQHAKGRCLTVLEGGYSDRALASASAAFLAGFTEPDSKSFEAQQERDGWWNEVQLKKLEKACAVAKGRRAAAAVGSPATLLAGAEFSADPWLSRAVEIFAHLEDTSIAPPPIGSTLAAARSGIESDPNTPRQLRDRKPRTVNYAQLADVSPVTSPARAPTTVRRSASASRLRPAKEEAPVETVLPPPPPPPPVPSVPAAFLQTAHVAASPSESSSSAVPHTTAFANVPAMSFSSPATGDAEESNAPLAKPSIRFTWKQGGFGGEPRM